ncbi:MAG: PorT family protein [Flavobacteriales bacterium]|nr:PorT family protein [Flavobacteriales bacterium]
MKKIVFSLIAILLVTLTHAQDDKKFRIGFKFNPNVSWMRPDAKEITSNGSVMRFGFALNLDKHFTENYAFGTGLNIFQTGGDLTYLESTTVNGDVPVIVEKTRNYRLQYAEIPLSLKLRTNEIGYITYWGQFGVGLGLNIRSKADDELDYLLSKGESGWGDSSLESMAEEDLDIKDDISIFRMSLVVGGGIEYSLSGTTAILAGVTFNNGFTDVLQGNAVKTDNADSPVFDVDNNPVMYKLKGITNHVEVNIGILF